MAPPNKVLNHSEKDEIIRRLTSGESVRDVSAWLAHKYPHKTQSHLRLSSSTLQAFRAEFLNLRGKLLEDITQVAQQTKEQIKQEVAQQEIQATNAYKEAISGLAQETLDTQRELIEIFHILKSRVEVLYNGLQNGNFSDKQEKALRDTLDKMMVSLEHYKKFVEGYTETTTTNVNVTVMSDQISIIREAVREILVEMEPDLAVKFMGKLNEKMRRLQYRPEFYGGTLDVEDVQVN